ncbi:COMM domain-containing protein 4 [Homalodisca vitripennis]|nr:COMM domain-containing protein 4 [Homalodisca vitripennis]
MDFECEIISLYIMRVLAINNYQTCGNCLIHSALRFRFCGDGDCPDWILAQINTLARTSSIKMKLLCQVVAESIVSETPINRQDSTDYAGPRVTSSVCEVIQS